VVNPLNKSVAQRSAQTLHGSLRSPLMGVTVAAWNRFVNALMISDDRGPLKGKPRAFNSRTYAGGLGCFGMLPKRLVEIGVLKAVVYKNGKAHASADKRALMFLANPIIQYKAFVISTKRYSAVKVELPAGMTKSGALALFHRLGPNALLKWQQHQEPSTVALYQRANGLF
jgi:hypothetical protein